MASKKTQNGFEVWTIASPDGKARMSFVPEKGGIGSSLTLPGPNGPRELLYRHDFFWDAGAVQHIPGGWPFLFPVCGRLERNGQAETWLFDGRTYKLPSHGFGPRMPWQVSTTDNPSELVLQLSDTEATRKAYPFRFTVRLAYRMENNALVCEQTYTNNGRQPMPYYAGFHPYFLTPEPGRGKADVRLDFKPVKAFKYNERLTDLAGEIEPPDLPLSIDNPALNEMLTRVGADKETRLILPDGLIIHMAAEGVGDPDLFPYVQLYSMKDRPFFCVEPWMAFPNALNTVRGVRWLAPDSSDQGLLKIWTS